MALQYYLFYTCARHSPLGVPYFQVQRVRISGAARGQTVALRFNGASTAAHATLVLPSSEAFDYQRALDALDTVGETRVNGLFEGEGVSAPNAGITTPPLVDFTVSFGHGSGLVCAKRVCGLNAYCAKAIVPTVRTFSFSAM